MSKYSSNPLELTYENVITGTKLKWNKISTSDFVQYIIVRSSIDSISDIKSSTTLSNLPIIAKIIDPNKTEFLDNSNITSKIYYRVFAQLGNRFLGSSSIVLNANITLVPSLFFEFLYNPKRNFVYLFDRNNGSVSLYDVNKTAVIKTARVVVNSNNSFYLNLGQFNGVDELQVMGADLSNGTGVINVFDAATLDLKEQIQTGLSSAYLLSFCSDNTGILYAFSNYNATIQAVSRAQKTILSTNNIPSSSNNLHFKRLADSRIVGVPAASDDATMIYAATNLGSTKRQIDVFGNPSLNFIKSILTKTFARNIYNIGNNQLLIISDGFNIQTGLQCTFFEKIDLNK